MPVFNRGALACAAIDSILNQTIDDFEIVVVNDGSTDDTVQFIRKNYPMCTLLTQNNLGPGAARNHGVANSTGRYIAFLDSDDLWFPWTLESYARAIAENDSPSFMAGKPFEFSIKAQISRVAAESLSTLHFNDYLESGDEWRWHGVSSFVVKRDAFQSAGGFVDGRINSEDADLALRLGTAKGFVQITSPYTFAYRLHDGNVTNQTVKTSNGLRCMLSTEKSLQYPGGKARASERWRIISRHVRPHILNLARAGEASDALGFFFSTNAWHLKTMRWKFLLGVPLTLAKGLIRKAIRERRSSS